MKIPPKFDESVIESDEVSATIVAAAFRRLEAEDPTLVACAGVYPDPGLLIPGAEFEIELLVPEEWETGDSRLFKADSLTARDFPITLYWQELTGSGHDGAAIVGRIESAERLQITPEEEVTVYLEDGTEATGTVAPTFGGWGRARGVFDNGVWGREAERLVRTGFLRGVSVDLDKFVGTVKSAPEEELAEGGIDDIIKNSDEKIESEKIEIDKARIMAATLTGKPAFQECIIRIVEPEYLDMPLELVDGEYEEDSDDLLDVLAVMTASAAPMVPPTYWFYNPELKKPTPLTVDDDGRVYGHIAAWNISHIGMAGQVKPPRSRTDYAYFKTGVVRTDNGSDVAVGQLTLAGGHASTTLNARQAMKHYDDTASAVVDVTVGEDKFGIWVAGALRPEATAAQVRALRASAPSGDWRPIQGRLELVAACCVNVPGFPIARALIAGGQIHALVAAGARELAELRDPIRDFEDRLAAIEHKEFTARLANLGHMRDVVQNRDEALIASATNLRRRILGPSLAEQRESLKNRII